MSTDNTTATIESIEDIPDMTALQMPEVAQPATDLVVPTDLGIVAPTPPEPEPVAIQPRVVQLTPEEVEKKNAIVAQINFNDSSLALNYGVGLEKALAPITEGILSSTRTRDLGAVGGLITNVMVQV